MFHSKSEYRRQFTGVGQPAPFHFLSKGTFVKLANSDLELTDLWLTKDWCESKNGRFVGFTRGFFKPISSFPELGDKIVRRYTLHNAIDGTEREAQDEFGKSLRCILADGFNRKIEDDCNSLIAQYIRKYNKFPSHCVLEILSANEKVDEAKKNRDGIENIYTLVELIIAVANEDFTIIEQADNLD